MSSPRSAKHNIMLAVEEIRRICRIELHRLESLMLLQHGASPFPNTTQLGLTRELVPVRCHRNRVPVFENHIRGLEVDKEVG